MKSRRRLLPLLALLLIAGSGLLATRVVPAQALAVAGIKLNDAHPRVKQSYNPIPCCNPSGQVGDPSTSDCSTFPMDDLIQVDISFKRQFGTLDTFKVSWTAPQNDIDVWFYDDGGHVIGKSTTSNNPETVRLGNLANGTYYICAVNFSGANTGITVDASREFLTLYKYTPPPETPLPKAAGGVAPAPVATPTPVAAPGAPAVTAEPVVTPGPNGPNAKQGLVGVAGAEQASNKTKRSIAGLVFLILTVLIAVVGMGFVAMRIRHDTM